MAKKATKTSGDLKLLQKLSLFFFNRPRKTAVLFLLLAVLGILSYTTFLKREGFPKIEIPVAVSSGAYIGNDASKVDNDIAKPMSDLILKEPNVKTVQSQSFDNFYTVIVQFDQGTNAQERSNQITEKVKAQKILPDGASNKIEPVMFGYTERGDELVVSFYSKQDGDYQKLADKAQEASDWIKSQNIALLKNVSIINPFEKSVNPVTGQESIAQKSFERYGRKEGDQTKYYQSVVIGISGKAGADRIDLYNQVKDVVSKLNQDPKFVGYGADVTASDAPSINKQVSELQKTLLEGLIAVLVVGSIIIAVRASLITVLSMLTVLAITNLVLYLIGYSLNTMTLFSLVLGLSLIVDDTIIMVEALDNYRRRLKNPDEIVSTATGRVSKAMIAATLTACLSFAPLIFVGGIIGGFVRQIPITIILALLTSLIVALVFIPFFARRLMLTKNQINKRQTAHGVTHLEHQIAEFLMKPMLWAKGHTGRLVSVTLIAIFIGLGFIGASGFMFNKVKFNIFPQTKDSDYITVSAVYRPGTTIDQAEQINKEIQAKTTEVLGKELVTSANFGSANAQNSTDTIELTDYQKRSVTSQEFIKRLKDRFANYDKAVVTFGQIDAGPPASAFNVQVNTQKGRDNAEKLANDIANFVRTTDIKRPDGSKIQIDNVLPVNNKIYARDDGKPYIAASVNFKDSDTTTLVTLTQKAIEDKFNTQKLKEYGLDKSDLNFNSGQESENQDSFKTLIFAFPLLMLVIYILLTIEFRSFLQPLLIFMAIPFSLLGITLGLYWSNNPFSFFAMLGFFALIGLSIKNTILLTDYANQARRAGKGPIDAMHEALAERFRPLIATSLTAVTSLIPLAITSPFWEGLAYVLIGGLLCSTLLVVTIFPYYYLAAEFLRLKTSRAFRRIFKNKK